MVWILLATLIVSAIFFLMVFRQASRAEERLRLLVVKLEGRISRRYGGIQKAFAAAGKSALLREEISALTTWLSL